MTASIKRFSQEQFTHASAEVIAVLLAKSSPQDRHANLLAFCAGALDSALPTREVLALFKASGADINAVSSQAGDRMSPFLMGIAVGSADRVSAMIDAGGKINGPAPEGSNTPLMHALGWNRPATALLLLDLGADAAQCNGRGETAWHRAAFSCPDISMHQALLAHGANINAVDVNGTTPLMVACDRLSGDLPTPDTLPEVIEWLLGHGANHELANGNRETAVDLLREINPKLATCFNAILSNHQARQIEADLPGNQNTARPRL